MPEQALYLKWRPMRFEEVVGQDHITRTLKNSLKTDRIRHAYLFSGLRGTGKTTSARLLAKAVNCTAADAEQRPCNECLHCISINEGRFLDLIEIDAASHTGVDDVRDLRDKIAFSPSEGRYKVYIIDEVHRFSGNAFDALLKTLEEPPEHAIFILATTEIDKVPATIKSRCLPFEFRRISLRDLTDHLQRIVDAEGIQVERAALELIARQGTGSARDSISLLDQIIADPDELISLALTERVLGTANTKAVKELVQAFVEHNVTLCLHILNQAIDGGSDPKQFGQQLIEQLRSILIAQTAGTDLIEASQEDCDMYQKQAKMIDRAVLLKAIRLFTEAINDISGGWQPQLPLELALIEAFQNPEPAQVMSAQPAPKFDEGQHPAVSPTQPGSKPIIPLSVIKTRWPDVQRLIFPHNQMLAGTLDYIDVVNIDGNRLTLGAKEVGHLRIIKDRIDWIERALFRIHDVHLNVQVVSSGNGQNHSAENVNDDPLVDMARELGGQVKED
ncbi:hypothetical protein MASR2M15_10120 [Anaerolineales bacterium]